MVSSNYSKSVFQDAEVTNWVAQSVFKNGPRTLKMIEISYDQIKSYIPTQLIFIINIVGYVVSISPIWSMI